LLANGDAAAMTPDATRPARLAILGGGLTGAALAIHAIRSSKGRLAIDLVEPAADLGRGIAYGTTDPVHRINVPSHRMSLFGDDSEHLTRWLFAHGLLPDPASTDARDQHYVARAAFGNYVADVLAETVAAAGPRAAFRHHRVRAVAITAAGSGWTVGLSDGRSLEADGVALCCGHAAPVLPCAVTEAAQRHSGFVRNPWIGDAFAPIGQRDAVLLVGTGLTMADAVASLVRTGHRGPVTAISRRGLLARPQGLFLDGFDAFADALPPTTALGLLRLVRRRVRDLEADVGWEPVVDALRLRLFPIWTGLPPAEQRRVVRRLLPFWEVHRFRAAPQPHDLLEAERREGRLTVERAGLVGLDAEGGRLVATLRRPGGRTERRAFDAVVLCTGPGNALDTDPLVGGLVAAGLVRPDAVGLGLAVDAESRLRDRHGGLHATFRAFGPVTRGSFGEMTGEPDIVRHVARIAPGLLGALRSG
jgi:uncharacterized NAD(P)/FAD-binding protein YdhS